MHLMAARFPSMTLITLAALLFLARPMISRFLDCSTSRNFNLVNDVFCLPNPWKKCNAVPLTAVMVGITGLDGLSRTASSVIAL
jgi:hypothetical protein